MRFIIALLPVLLLVSGCTAVPEAPGISSEELLAIEARYGKEARERVQSWRQLIAANKPQAHEYTAERRIAVTRHPIIVNFQN